MTRSLIKVQSVVEAFKNLERRFENSSFNQDQVGAPEKRSLEF